MLNILDDYVWRSLPEWGAFCTSSNLEHKVDKNGRFLPFYGNTVVFLLDDTIKKQLFEMQQSLYSVAGEMLSEQLQPSTFHMTLHDLVNGSDLNGTLKERMSDVEPKAREILTQFHNQSPLRMSATWMFNMVNTSIVLGLKPIDKDSWYRLDGMYNALEDVVPLGYGLTPHITMAYYRPGSYSQEELSRLRMALGPVDLKIELRVENLVLQYFCDMNTYSDTNTGDIR